MTCRNWFLNVAVLGMRTYVPDIIASLYVTGLPRINTASENVGVRRPGYDTIAYQHHFVAIMNS